MPNPIILKPSRHEKHETAIRAADVVAFEGAGSRSTWVQLRDDDRWLLVRAAEATVRRAVEASRKPPGF